MGMRSFPGRTYRFYTGTPLYPFGYGLSYTTFTFTINHIIPIDSKPGLSDEQLLLQPFVKPRDTVTVNVTVQNTGAVAGDVAVLAFVSSPPSVTQECPLEQLFGFQKIQNLQPSSQVTLQFSLTGDAAMCYNSEGRAIVR